MSAIIDLDAATKDFCKRKGYPPYKAFNFGRLKLKIQEHSWENVQPGTNQEGATRIVDLTNNSMQAGLGQFSIEKKAKPVFSLELTKGIVKGLPYRVKFPGPRGVLDYFFAPVNTETSHIQEHTGLIAETTIPLPSLSAARAELSNKTHLYKGKFGCNAELSGLIIVIKKDDKVTEIPVEQVVDTNIHIEGAISINFQDTHNINVQ